MKSATLDPQFQFSWNQKCMEKFQNMPFRQVHLFDFFFFQTTLIELKSFKFKRKMQTTIRDLSPDTFLFVQSFSPMLALFKNKQTPFLET